MTSLANKLAVPLASKLALAIAQGIGSAGDPLLAAMLAESPIIAYDNNNLGTFWADTTATTPATINGAVARQDDISGNGFHRTQANLANRPVLRGTPTGANLFTAYSSPDAGWVDSGSGVATATATTGNISTNVAPTASRVYRIRYTCTVTGGSVRPVMGGVNGVTRTASGTYEEYITATSTAVLNFNGTGFTGTVSAIDARDVSADAVTSPYGLQYDGVDDFLQTATVSFAATDKMTVCIGAQALSNTQIGTIAELSTNGNTNNGTFYVRAPRTAGVVGSWTYAVMMQTPNTRSPVGTGFTVPSKGVLTGWSDASAPYVRNRLNGGAFSEYTLTQGDGNFGSYPLFFGRRGGTSLPFDGLDFGLSIFPVVKSGAGLTAIEAFAADRTGVTL